jgi:hypothetical protein
MWARRLLVKEVREKTSLLSHFMLALFLVISAAGYITNVTHTDIIEVKSFFVGLVTFHWSPLPADAPLLIHLWLVALLMVSLPFSQLLHMAGVLATTPAGAMARPGFRLRRTTAALLAVLLLVPAALAAVQLAGTGWTTPPPDLSKLARAHRKDDPTVMVRNHPNFLFHSGSMTVYQGVRQDVNRLETCVDCHAVKGADGQPVGAEDPNHFCTSCHYRAAVTIDCFECHISKPPNTDHAAAGSPRQSAADTTSTTEKDAAR